MHHPHQFTAAIPFPADTLDFNEDDQDANFQTVTVTSIYSRGGRTQYRYDTPNGPELINVRAGTGEDVLIRRIWERHAT